MLTAVFIFIVIIISALANAHTKSKAQRRREESEKATQQLCNQIASDRKAAIRRLTGQVKDIVPQHVKTLTQKKAQLIQTDDYGQPVFDDWIKEIEYFRRSVLAPKVSSDDRFYLDQVPIYEIVDEAVIAYWNEHKEEMVYAPVADLTPIEYENYCRDLLRSCGWNARTTKASGDQGIDIIAERNEMKVVLQCKKHIKAVGNKAVQEITAGQKFEDAHYGVVVSNSGFTPAAKQLANKNKILLMHHNELPDLLERLETL